jgi:PIN domain nuclease of toxin-antitoxin system
MPLRDWIDESLETPGLRVIDIEPEIAAEAANLPGAFAGDGADRLIVATARNRHAFLLSADQNLKRYAADGHVRLMEV